MIIAGLLSVIVCLASLGGTTYALFSQNDDANTQTITIGESTETAAFELVFENTDTYLYRLGNDDSVKLGSLFKDAYDSLTDSDAASASEDSETETTPTAAVDDASVQVTVTQHTTANGYTTDDCDSSLAATLSYNTSSWEDGTISFNNYTGVVTITITADNAAACTLYVEVIDGVNIESSDSLSTSYSKNVILLADTSLIDTSSDGSGSYLTLSKCTLYGNGFAINATNGITKSSQYGIVRLSDANLDNVAIDGPEYTDSNAGLYTSSSYNTAAVRTSGDCTITNSYIEGGNCALKVESENAAVTVSDSVFVGGCWANIEVKYGELIIEGTVTTVNEPNSSVNTVGLGIVVGSPGNLDDDACVTIADDATLNQYNWLYYSNDSSYFTMTGVSTIVSAANNISSIKSGNYVNMGILFLNGNIEGSSGMPEDYTQASASITVLGSTYSGYIWAPTSIPDDGLTYRSSAYTWSPSADTPYEPTYTWSYPTDYDSDNYDAVYAEIDSGDSYTLSNVSSILSAKKHGNTLSISVSVESPDDVTAVSYDSSADSISFSESGTYTIIFTVTDPCVYDEKGVRTSESYSLVQEMNVIINVKNSSIKTAEFTFTYGSTTYSSTTTTINGVTYVMPDVSSTSDSIGQTDDGVYYVIVDGLGYKSGTSIYRYVPLFAGVTIKDYTDADGSYVTYDASYSPDDTSTTDDPAVTGLEWVSIDGSMTYGWDGYEMYDDYYCRATVELSSSNWNNEITVVVTYRFTATNGDVYYYCIGYYFDEEQTSGCFPTGTLITLADGSQVAVEDLTGDEELLVFDHETGEYTASNILFIEDYGYDSYDVVTLSFSEGYETKLIYEHAYFDLTLNKYVYINDDTLYDYIGDEFVMGDGEDIYAVTLEAVTVSAQETNCYSLVTAYQLNYFTDGFLSIPSGIEGLFNIFEYGEGLKYDEELMAADIETYGLLEYEALSDYVTEEVFNVFNGKYLAVSMGKGLITLEDIEYLANRYGIYFDLF